MSDSVTLPREVVEKAVKAFENGCPPTCEKGMIDSGGFHPWGEPALAPCPACLAFEHLRTHLAAEQPKPVTLSRVALAWSNRKGTKFVGNGEKWKHEDCVVPLYATEPQKPSEDIEALRRDAERWRFYEAAGSNLTLRLHNTRSDHRNAVIDAAMGDKR